VLESTLSAVDPCSCPAIHLPVIPAPHGKFRQRRIINDRHFSASFNRHVRFDRRIQAEAYTIATFADTRPVGRFRVRFQLVVVWRGAVAEVNSRRQGGCYANGLISILHRSASTRRMRLIEALWESIEQSAANGDADAAQAVERWADVDPELLAELEREADEAEKDPSSLVSWEALLAELKQKRRVTRPVVFSRARHSRLARFDRRAG